MFSSVFSHCYCLHDDGRMCRRSTVPLCPVLTCFVSKWLTCDVVVVVDDNHNDNDNNVINAILAVNVTVNFLKVIAVKFVQLI